MEKDLDMSYQVEQFYKEACPIGSMDLNSALKTIVESGLADKYDANEKLWELIEEYNTSMGDFKYTLEKSRGVIDICYIVYDAILQKARGEIEDLTGFDIQNDADFYVNGDYYCASFDYTEQDIDNLKEVIKDKKFSETTQFFLSEVGL